MLKRLKRKILRRLNGILNKKTIAQPAKIDVYYFSFDGVAYEKSNSFLYFKVAA